ncbi:MULTISPECIES: heme-degrading domain-containing protein [unclassified Sinorhizobium]|uniref:heme-degrading domain-containing protein n=1 Tax=unclassified Sinorhizobium TaxID=2613772 RepID=UPI0024C371AC|nr:MULTISPECIES: heme-degrading domain-containing protein [unclassified Sinorhizobium]MDK1377067.1 heme-degrading domain-containing protein [Sinorhizobium sp. 6-70]MDK1479638.1 heme-degrading domain-containing protein [Sinorhizobium sp. 6-117]
MNIDNDLRRIALQERELQFEQFNLDTAWELGSTLRRMAAERKLGVVIDITLFSMQVFYAALEGATPDNPNWVRRKRNTVFRLFKSSYATGLGLLKQQTNLQAKLGLPDAEYAAHGGSFPIVVKGTGCIGAVTVSGLPQREDHNLVVEALAELFKADHAALKLED